MDIVYGCLLFIFIYLLWYLNERFCWYKRVICMNPLTATLHPVATQVPPKDDVGKHTPFHKVIAPRCTFKQYLKYLYLSCIPYMWSVPIKFLFQMISRLTNSNLSDIQKRQRLAKMMLETSLVLGFTSKQDETTYIFEFKNFRIPTKEKNEYVYHYVKKCVVEVSASTSSDPELISIFINNTKICSIDEMFSILNTIWCVYTHTLTHTQAGNIAEINLEQVQNNSELTDDFKSSIDDMHAAVSGMNESANHYPADIWGIPRKHLQVILGYNSTQTIYNHASILQCCDISNFVKFSMKSRLVFQKHFKSTNLPIATLSANTIFHSIDHYNMGKYFLHEKKEKSFKGIDSRMITSLLGDLNYDLGRWQGMKYSKCKEWKSVFQELEQIDQELANKTHMFVSV